MNNQTEQWLPVVGCEDFYAVSNMGNIKRLAKARGASPGRVLRPFLCGSRKCVYPTIAMYCNKKEIRKYVHALVAEAFIGPRPEGMQINHKNGNCSDNTVGNLEYVTPSENHIHAYRVLGRKCSPRDGERNGNAVLTRKQVDLFREQIKTAPRGWMKKQAEILGVSPQTLSWIKRGETWK